MSGLQQTFILPIIFSMNRLVYKMPEIAFPKAFNYISVFLSLSKLFTEEGWSCSWKPQKKLLSRPKVDLFFVKLLFILNLQMSCFVKSTSLNLWHKTEKLKWFIHDQCSCRLFFCWSTNWSANHCSCNLEFISVSFSLTDWTAFIPLYIF